MKLLAPCFFAIGLLASACSSSDEPKNTPPIDAGGDREIVTDATPPQAASSQETSQPDGQAPDGQTPDGQAPDAPNDASCVRTWDIGTESMAEQICKHQSNCKVCVQ